jgi:hypothetical protein
MRPGIIRGPGIGGPWARAVRSTTTRLWPFSSVDVSEVAGAAIDQCLNGFEMETFANADIVRVGNLAVQKQATDDAT